jgi:hypothetical protein
MDTRGGIRWITADKGPDVAYVLHGVSPAGHLLRYVGVEPYEGVAAACRNIFTVR